MNTIRINYNETVTVNRLRKEETGYKQEYEQHLPALPCHCQPSDPTVNETFPGAFGKDFVMFCDWVDIIEGDQVIRDEVEYRVAGVEKLSFMGNRHMEVVLRAFRQ